MNHYDLVIIGAGPSGANLARLISPDLKVLLLDKRLLSDPFNGSASRKCCGGLLAPDAQKMIASMGLGIPKDILVSPQLFSVRTIDLDQNLQRDYQRYYYNMDREKFDRWLISLIPEHVDRSFGAVFRHYQEDNGGLTVEYFHEGELRKVHTKVLVGADGANSKVRELLSKTSSEKSPLPKKYISIQQVFRCNVTIPYYTALFDATLTDFYAWTIPKDGELFLGAALEMNGHEWETFNTLKEKLTAKGYEFDHLLRTEGAFINRPLSPTSFNSGTDKVLLIGEAAGAISPSSAEGISYALKTSLMLAESINEGIAGCAKRYARKALSIKKNLFLKRLKSPAMYQPTLRKLAIQSGLMGLKTSSTSSRLRAQFKTL